MPSRHQILLVSRSKDAAQAINDCFREAHEVDIETRIVTNGHVDPLVGVDTLPDLLLLRVAPETTLELEAVASYSPDDRPPLIVIGDTDDAQTMRAAMQAGARDFLSEPIEKADLLAAVKRLTAELNPIRKTGTTELTAFVNAKGGSGGTFLATNTAHMLAKVSNRRTALVDLDLQFGSLPQYLDLKPKRGLLEALNVADDLDGVAVEAYMAKHETGLAVLAATNFGIELDQDRMVDGFNALLDQLVETYERVIFDVPRQIDQLGAATIERADKVVIVMQQSVPSVHDAVRLYEILIKDLAVLPDHVTVVVNRYVKNASVSLTNIEQALRGKTLFTIPNDFHAAFDSINIGVPIYEHARRSSVTKALLRLEEFIDGRPAATPKSFITRLRGVAG